MGACGVQVLALTDARQSRLPLMRAQFMIDNEGAVAAPGRPSVAPLLAPPSMPNVIHDLHPTGGRGHDV